MTINDPKDDPQYQVGGENYKAQFEKAVGSGVPPSTVNKFHNRSDVDSGPNAQHHTIGTKQDQVTSGAHNHNGENSVLIMKGMIITGAKAGNTALASVIAQLVKLGATDNTT